jgi:hypothetical protein
MSYLSALGLCTVVLGALQIAQPASANTIGEIVSQGSSSMTGDIYSQGMVAENGPWAGEIYSQGMMMSDGQIYSQGMEITWQDAEPGPQFGNPSWFPPSNTDNTGGNQSIDNTFSPPGDDPVSLATDAFTNHAGFNPPADGNPGANSNPGGNLSLWTDLSRTKQSRATALDLAAVRRHMNPAAGPARMSGLVVRTSCCRPDRRDLDGKAKVLDAADEAKDLLAFRTEVEVVAAEVLVQSAVL